MTSASRKRIALCAIACVVLSTVYRAAAEVMAPFPGTRSTWNGFDRYDFEIHGQTVLVVAPREVAPGKPWVWHGEFFGHRPEPDIALLGRGFHIVYMKIPDLFGAPQAVAYWNGFHKELTERHGLAKKAALVGVSRGGLYCYNWAAANPDKVACIYGDAPVCDLKSWPLGKGKGTGNPNELPKLLKVYGVTNEAELLAKAVSPIDNLEPLAKARVPLLHVYGDADKGVPWDENTEVLAERYRKLGGEITLIAKPGVGHVHGLDDSTPIIEFISRHSLHSPVARQQAPLQIGSRRELFVDRYLIERLTNCRLQLHEPRDEGIAIKLDKPFEGPHSGYATVIRDGDRLLMYYRGISKLGLDGGENERTCIAESRDGIAWTKPDLGFFEFEGNKSNNIVLDKAAPVTHNFCPMLDTRAGVSKQERFKAVGGTGKELFAFASADGLQWNRLIAEPILDKRHMPFPFTHLFDSQNLAFWSEAEQSYICYFRVWDGLRRVARTTSKDFVTWSPAVLMEQVHDDGISGPRPAPPEHIYTNQTSPYFRAPHIYVAIAARFFEGRQVLNEAQARAVNVSPQYFQDTSDAVFMTSRGGNVYDRTFLEGYLKPGIGHQNWVSRTNYPALNIVQTSPAEMSLYVNQDYAQPTAHIRRYRLRLDGFSSLRAGASEGELLTKLFVFSGKLLAINFATSAGGGLRFELQDSNGMPLPGFALADCQEQIGNEIERVVTWKSNLNLQAIAGQTVRMRIVVRDADLFAFQFAP